MKAIVDHWLKMIVVFCSSRQYRHHRISLVWPESVMVSRPSSVYAYIDRGWYTSFYNLPSFLIFNLCPLSGVETYIWRCMQFEDSASNPFKCIFIAFCNSSNSYQYPFCKVQEAIWMPHAIHFSFLCFLQYCMGHANSFLPIAKRMLIAFLTHTKWYWISFQKWMQNFKLYIYCSSLNYGLLS